MGKVVKVSFRPWFWYVLAVFFAGACKVQPVTSSRVMHVIGEDHMHPLSPADPEYSQFAQGIKASVLLAMDFPGSKRYCSGFIFEVREDYLKVLSNHHCFAVQDEDNNGLATEELIEDVCSMTQVYFNALEGLESSITKGYCVEGTLSTNFVADIAVFAVAGDIPANVQSISIASGSDVEISQEPAYIVHYPLGKEYVYPSPDLGSARLPAAIITNRDCRILGDFAPEQFEKNPVLALSYKHTCDLTKGSSGSPLLSQSSHELVGLNWGGVKTTVGDQTDVSNAAVKASHILTFLNNDSGLDESIEALIAKHSTTTKGDFAATGKSSSKSESSSSASGCSSLGVRVKSSQGTVAAWWLLCLLPWSLLWMRKYFSNISL